MITVQKTSEGADSGVYRLELSFSGTSEEIVLAPGMMVLSAGIHPAPGQTARIEYTISLRDRVEAGTARWIDWPMGDITESGADSLVSMATAIRGVASGGTATLELAAK